MAGLGILYHYFEASPEYRDNLLHFLLFGWRPDAEIYVIQSSPCSVPLPAADNLHYVTAPNRNHDFGGYATALAGPVDPAAHDHLLFINSSVRGPYLPPHLGNDWVAPFLAPFARPDVGISGASINILAADTIDSQNYARRHGGSPPFSHVQSMAYCLPRASLALLMDAGFFANDTALGKAEVIADYEIRLSQTLIAAGFDLACLLPEYDTIDYRRPHGDINPTSLNGDACFADSYFGRTLHPYEVMFVKTNRQLWPNVLLDRLSLSRLHRGAPLPEAYWSEGIADYAARLRATEMESRLAGPLEAAKAAALDAILADIQRVLVGPFPPARPTPQDPAKAWALDTILAGINRVLHGPG